MSWSIVQSDCIDFLNAQKPDSIDLVLGSPLYCDARTYGIGAVYDCQGWVDWMLKVTEAAVRVSKGLVLWVAAGVQRDLCYWPACEGLMWEWWKRGNQLWRPCIWWKVDEDDGGTGIPGSGGKQWLRNDWEYVMAFKKEGWLPYADPLVMGHAPVYSAVGGEMSNRTQDGKRINDAAARRSIPRDQRWGGSTRSKNGEMLNGSKDNRRARGKVLREMDVMAGSNADGTLKPNRKAPMPKIANPGNCIIVKARVGGGHMGWKGCHENEAPFPEKLAEFFVRSFCPPLLCSNCGFAVHPTHENKNMQDVQRDVPHAELATPILLPSMPDNWVQDGRGSEALFDMRQGVPDVGLTHGPKPILQQTMPVPEQDEATRELSPVRKADTEDSPQCPVAVLLQDMRVPLVGNPSQDDKISSNNTKGVHSDLHAQPHQRDSSRLCDGASTGHGKPPRKASRKRRGGPSQKREEVRQSTGKSGVDEQGGPRLASQATKSTNLSGVRIHHRQDTLCASCGSDLSSPGAIRAGLVCDPFSGSGTVAAVSKRHGRNFVGCDLRQSQVDIGLKRLAQETTCLFV